LTTDDIQDIVALDERIAAYERLAARLRSRLTDAHKQRTRLVQAKGLADIRPKTSLKGTASIHSELVKVMATGDEWRLSEIVRQLLSRGWLAGHANPTATVAVALSRSERWLTF
jgi:hypothetical protein